MSANYDAWKTTEPEPFERWVKCLTRGCDHAVTFPDFESYCTSCLVEHERERERLQRQSELVENLVRR